MAEENGKTIPAPYLPFKSFLSSLDPFTQGIPPKIDRSIWRQSGLMQGLIMNAYRFFYLIDENDKPTKALQQLATNTDARKAEIVKLLRAGYPTIMAHDLMTMTPKILDDEMENYNVSGETKKKAVTFFLQAAKFTEIGLSNFLTQKIRTTTPRRRKAAKSGRNEEPLQPHSLGYVPLPANQGGSSRTIVLSGGGVITLSVSADVFGMNREDREFVFNLIDALQKYELSHPQTVEDGV